MPTSQFTFYASSDASAPQRSGTAGSLLTVLDAILVNGYGAKAAAGWTKPIANVGNCGHYKQSAGSGFHVFINDNGPNGTSTFKEAWATGWETMTSIAAPVGAGSGQFPTAAQLLTTGHVVVRKSSVADASTRYWSCFADAYTFYFFAEEAPATGLNGGLWFGDIYSIRTGSPEIGRCIIVGGSLENSAVASDWSQTSQNTGVMTGHFMARDWGGTGGSVTVGKFGNYAWNSGSTNLAGTIPAPNGPDNSYYVTPLVVHSTNKAFRGRMRGVYQSAHPSSTYAEGASITGTGDNAGKTFQRSPLGLVGGGFVFIETSATVETN
jgi:hypothetical protein